MVTQARGEEAMVRRGTVIKCPRGLRRGTIVEDCSRLTIFVLQKKVVDARGLEENCRVEYTRAEHPHSSRNDYYAENVKRLPRLGRVRSWESGPGGREGRGTIEDETSHEVLDVDSRDVQGGGSLNEGDTVEFEHKTVASHVSVVR
jgi:hypothetical protein